MAVCVFRVTVLLAFEFDERKRAGIYILSLSPQIDRCTSICIIYMLYCKD